MRRRLIVLAAMALSVVASGGSVARADAAEEARLRRRVAELEKRVAELEAQVPKVRPKMLGPFDLRLQVPERRRTDPMVIPAPGPLGPRPDWLRVPSATGDFYLVPTGR
jgi:hypothetical protein